MASDLDRAVSELGAVVMSSGPHAGDYAYYDEGMRRWYIVTADDLAAYPSYLDHNDEQISGDAYSHWCAGTTAEEMPAGWDPSHPEHVHCECGTWNGEPCSWWGPTEETVMVEYMPEQHRASHESAGNAGTYPHNGAVRVRVERSCAETLMSVPEDREWAAVIP